MGKKIRITAMFTLLILGIKKCKTDRMAGIKRIQNSSGETLKSSNIVYRVAVVQVCTVCTGMYRYV